MLGGEGAHATAAAVEQGSETRRTTGGRTSGDKQPAAPKAAPISKVAKSKPTVDKRGAKRGQGNSATGSRKATTSRAEEKEGEYDAWMNELSSDEGSDDEPPSTRLRAMSIEEERGRVEPPTKRMRSLVIDEGGLDSSARTGRAVTPVGITASPAARPSSRTLAEAAEDRLSKSIASAMQSARMTIPERPTFDGEGDVERYIDEARLYIEQFPNEDDEKKVLRLSTGLNGPLRDPAPLRPQDWTRGVLRSAHRSVQQERVAPRLRAPRDQDGAQRAICAVCRATKIACATVHSRGQDGRVLPRLLRQGRTTWGT